MNNNAHRTYQDPYPGRKGDEVIESTCGKCMGQGRINWGAVNVEFIDPRGNRQVGRGCFDCHGSGVIRRTVKSYRRAERRAVKKYNEMLDNAEVHREEREQEAAEEAAREAAEKAAHDALPDCPTGRATITGRVLAVKLRHTAYGSSLKMLVESLEGYKVWGTLPRALEDYTDDELKATTVTFTADFTRSTDDSKFGFFKRPTKAHTNN